MAMNYEEVIDEFREGNLEIDCRAMTLIQRKDRGEIYRGKGYIRQADDGAFEFKLYVVSTENVTPYQSFARLVSVQAGSLHPDEVFYDLTAIAHDGTKWTAERLLPGFSWDIRDGEVIVHGHILSIKSQTDSQEKFTPFLQLHYFDEFELPFSKASETERWGQKRHTTDKAEFEGLGAKWKVRKRDQRVVVEIDSTADSFPPSFEYRVQEAFQFLAAKPVFWRARLSGNQTKVEFELVSPWRRSIKTQMGLPISRATDGYFQHSWRLFQLYLEYVAANTKDTQWNPVAYHLYNAIEASANSIDAWAVGYCVALEALTSFVSLENDAEHRGHIEGFQAKLRKWLAEETEYPDLVPRLDGMISGLASERVQDKLHELSETGHVTRSYIRSWTKLRNRHVHPRPVDLRKPDASYTQGMLDLIHQVEVLMFQLVFHLIGYNGPFTDYGAKGFPIGHYPVTSTPPEGEPEAAM